MGAVHFLGPQPIFEHSHRRVVQNNATLVSGSGSAVFSGIGARAVTLTVTVAGPVTGTNPTLDVSITEVDPGDQTTAYGFSASMARISAVATARSTRLYFRADTVKVTWSVGGTSPSFGGVYITLTEHTNETENEATAVAGGGGSWAATIQMAGRQYAVASFPAGIAAPNTALCTYSHNNGSSYVTVPLVYDPVTAAFVSSTITFSGAAETRVLIVPPGATHVRVSSGTSSSGTTALLTLRVNSNGAPWMPQLPLTLGSKTAANSMAVVPASDWVGNFNLATWLGGSTAPTVGQKAMVSSIPVTIASDQFESDTTATGTIGSGGDLVTLSVAGKRSVGVRIPVGSLTGTLCAQVTFDGSVWSLANFVDPTDGSYFFSFNVVAGQNPYYYIIPLIGGHTAQVRIGCLSYTSGTSGTITMRASPLPSNIQLAVPITTISKGLFVKNTDGVNVAAVKAASTAAVAADPSLVVALSPNSSFVKVWDGTNVQPAGDVALRARFNKLTDGTNTAAVKAASTAAVAADPAIVVAVSPNNTVPVAQALAATGTGTSITLSGASQTALAANANRKGATIYNNSTLIVYVAEFTPVSATSFTMGVAAGAAYNTNDYRGILTVIGAGTGAVLVTERT